MARATASRYATALADLVMKPESGEEPHEVAAQLQRFEDALAQSAELLGALLSPAVPPAKKRATVRRLGVELGLSALVRNFLFVVIDHRRVREFPEIREAFERLVDDREGMLRAEVKTARALPPAQQAAVEHGLARLTGQRVAARFAVDGGLIGGALAQIGSTTYDGSVRGQLLSLKKRLIASGA